MVLPTTATNRTTTIGTTTVQHHTETEAAGHKVGMIELMNWV